MKQKQKRKQQRQCRQQKQIARRQQLERRIVEAAEIVLGTCSSTATLLRAGDRFAAAIIDEAGQSTEPNCLIPLALGCTSLVMVGDQRQLRQTWEGQIR